MSSRRSEHRQRVEGEERSSSVNGLQFKGPVCPKGHKEEYGMMFFLTTIACSSRAGS